MRLKGIVEALFVGGFALLPAMAFGGRLDGLFATRDATAADGTNDVCIEVDGTDFSVDGFVSGTSGGCAVEVFYFTDLPHSASATALKTGKTTGNAKVSQSIFTPLFVDVFDADGTGPGTCADAFFGEAAPEKCKATASMKGTSVATGPDTVQSSRVSVACQLGVNLATVDTNFVTTGVQPPTAAQADIVAAAFPKTRKDAKITGKNDQLNIKQKGVPDTTTSFCD